MRKPGILLSEQAKNIYLGGMADHYNVAMSDYNEKGKLDEPSSKGYSSEIFAQRAIDFILSNANSDMEKPFFAWVAFTAPYDPCSPEAGYINHYPRWDFAPSWQLQAVASISVR